MKKLWALGVAICLLLAVIGVELSQLHQIRTTVILYEQGDLVSERVLTSFTDETGIDVQVIRLDEQEEALELTGCDLLLTDTDQLAVLMAQGELAALSELTETDLWAAVDEEYLGLAPDGESAYTVPQLWTMMGLLYDPTKTDIRVTGWINLFDGQLAGSIVMPQDSRQAFSVALTALGLDVNTQEAEDISAAASYLTQQQGQVYAYCAEYQLEALFENGTVVLAPCYAGTAIEVMSNLPELSFVIPSEGSWQTLFSCAIPADSQKQAEAAQLLEYLCQAENLARNAAYSGYSTVSSQAYELLDSAWQTNPLAYPGEEQVSSFPVLLPQSDLLRAQRQVRWLLIQDGMSSADQEETVIQQDEEAAS